MTDINQAESGSGHLVSTGSLGKSQEKVCEYMFPLSNKDLTRRPIKTRGNVEDGEEGGDKMKSRTKTRGGERTRGYSYGGEDGSKNELNSNSSIRHSNKSYTDTGGIYIYIFRNNDPYFLGKKMLVTEKIYRNWEQVK